MSPAWLLAAALAAGPLPWSQGRDPRLERALDVAAGLTQNRPPARPPSPEARLGADGPTGG